MSIKYIKADLFDVPDDTAVLGHACNCNGRWGAGVAAKFREVYPDAFQVYHEHCLQHKTEREKRQHLLGTCLLIPTQDHKIIACLFTSCNSGINVDPPNEILAATKKSIHDMWRQLHEWGFEGAVHLPLINSGLFRVPWEETEKVLQSVDGGGGGYIVHCL